MKQFYNRFKTIFAILGGILVCIQIYSWFTQPKTGISATIDIIDYTLPSEIKEQLSYGKSRDNIDTLFNILQIQSAGKIPDSSKITLTKYITTKFYVDYLSDFAREYKTLGVLKISNSGDKEIQDIQVSSRSNFFYEFSNNDGTTYTGVSNGKIKVGSLRPTEEITVRLYAIVFFDDDIKITYPDGAIKPEKTNKISGFWASLASIFPSFWSIFPILLFVMFPLLILIGYSIYNSGFKQGQIDSEKEKTASANEDVEKSKEKHP